MPRCERSAARRRARPGVPRAPRPRCLAPFRRRRPGPPEAAAPRGHAARHRAPRVGWSRSTDERTRSRICSGLLGHPLAQIRRGVPEDGVVRELRLRHRRGDSTTANVVNASDGHSSTVSEERREEDARINQTQPISEGVDLTREVPAQRGITAADQTRRHAAGDPAVRTASPTERASAAAASAGRLRELVRR